MHFGSFLQRQGCARAASGGKGGVQLLLARTRVRSVVASRTRVGCAASGENNWRSEDKPRRQQYDYLLNIVQKRQLRM